MPELPEVETVRRSLEPTVVGTRIVGVQVARRDLRRVLSADFEASLKGRRIEDVRRRAKYLLFALDDGRSWIVHLGMSGRLLLKRSDAEKSVKDRHQHVLVTLDDGSKIAFVDPRRFGLMAVERAEDSSLLTGIGPEPLDAEAFSGSYLARWKRRTRRAVKDVLMDQRVVAGVGNIYANEILYTAGVRPTRRMPRVTRPDCERIVSATRAILSEAIEHRGSTISDFLDGVGRRGGYQWRRRVYDRDGEPCPGCKSPIVSVVVGQRSSFYCPKCQS
jgi:formamidopyrimidine-DNA glycosylase